MRPRKTTGVVLSKLGAAHFHLYLDVIEGRARGNRYGTKAVTSRGIASGQQHSPRTTRSSLSERVTIQELSDVGLPYGICQYLSIKA
jgi:hypothetical protein